MTWGDPPKLTYPALGALDAADLRRVIALAAIGMRARVEKPALSWKDFRRPDQAPPTGSFRTWLILAGRGWGKTRTGAETLDEWARTGQAHKMAVVAQTAADARDVSVAALLTRITGFDKGDPPKPIFGSRPGIEYEPSKRRVTWANGAFATTFSAEDPDSLRGYEVDTAWLDEVAAWRFPDAFDQLQLGLRVGLARQVATTTPRPIRVVRELLADPRTVVTRGRTLDNAANLSADALAYLFARYKGTRAGRQELEGEVLEDVPGALWTFDDRDEERGVIRYGPAPLIERRGIAELNLAKLIVAVDPNASDEDGADECGIVVAGKGFDGRGYVLDDRSARVGPQAWARRVVQAVEDYMADEVVAEANQGGEMVRLTLQAARCKVPIKLVHASQGKRTRAEPAAMLYQQRRVLHARAFPELEEQLTHWSPESGESPDRLDALVWALTSLFEDIAPKGDGWGLGTIGVGIG